jgi:hypothetical protein
MTIQEILELGKMGYTKDDIEAMSGTSEADPVTVTVQTEDPVEEKAPDPAPVQAAAPDNTDMLKIIVGEFEKMNKAIQELNINNSNIPQLREKTADEVLADFIAPPKKGGKTK